jgi:hypothetical protein
VKIPSNLEMNTIEVRKSEKTVRLGFLLKMKPKAATTTRQRQ